MVFSVSARDSEGKLVSFQREADSRAELSSVLRTARLAVISIEEVADERRLPPPWHPSWLRPTTGFDIEIGLRQLASMLKSGLTLLRGLQTVAEQALSPRTKRTWLRVADSVSSGTSFAVALKSERRRFDEIVIRLAEVGEKAGELERAISRSADQMEAKRNLRNQVVNALAYPLVAVLLAIAVSVFLVVSVIPQIAEFLRTGGAALPALTQGLMDFADWVRAHGLTVAVALACSAAGWLLVRIFESGRELEDVILLRVPVAGRILRLSATALFSRSMQIMIESGVTLLDALKTAADLMANRRFRRRIVFARESIMRGVSLADSLSPAVEFMPMLRRMASVGEVSGSLGETFGETARFHEMMLSLAVKRFGMLIEPVMILIVGVLVGIVYTAFFLALFALAGAS